MVALIKSTSIGKTVMYQIHENVGFTLLVVCRLRAYDGLWRRNSEIASLSARSWERLRSPFVPGLVGAGVVFVP